MWDGRLVAVLSAVAAAAPPILTDVESALSRTPEKGWGRGVGTGPPGDGTMTMCVSTATTWSPCFAAGFPIS